MLWLSRCGRCLEVWFRRRSHCKRARWLLRYRMRLGRRWCRCCSGIMNSAIPRGSTMTWSLFISVVVSAAVVGHRSGFSLVTSRRVLHLGVKVSWSRGKGLRLQRLPLRRKLMMAWWALCSCLRCDLTFTPLHHVRCLGLDGVCRLELEA